MASGLNPGLTKLIQALADGNCHSGEQLGAELGVSRAAVWKQLKHLDALQLHVEAVPGSGYRLTRPVDLYDAARLASAYRAQVGSEPSLEITGSTGSTNSDLMARSAQASQTPHFLFTEHQSAGRGRRGRNWQTPYGGTIAFSMLRRFECAPAELGSLSLIAGVSLVQTLQRHGAGDLGLKWPNDLMHRDRNGELRKLGGVLVEVRSEAEGPCSVVIGAGINYALATRSEIDQPWIDLQRLLDLRAHDRSRLAGELAAAMALASDGADAGHSASFLARWTEFDLLQGERVTVHRGAETIAGVASGVDAGGALLLQVDGALHPVRSGEVSVRRQP